jgi:hypothetical protein
MFLGIEVNTLACELRLPEEKLLRLRARLEEWGDRKACQRKELESLVGLLNHACKVVRSGQSFLRRMNDLLHGMPDSSRSNHPIRLNREFRSDLAWWRSFVSGWNGKSFLPPAQRLSAVEMASDASGSWGCGAWHGTHWFQVQWDHRLADAPIMVKELIPVVLAAELWGGQWSDCLVRCYCDNQAVVACLRSRTSKNRHVMHMLRVLAFVEARHRFYLSPLYLSTTENFLADDLSRDNLVSFLSKVPDADSSPAATSSALLDLLLTPEIDWVSPAWQSLFADIFRQGSQHPPKDHTTRE